MASINNTIRHKKRLSQAISFDNVDLGNNMFPTDIDAVFEYKDKAYIFYEVKLVGKALSLGQKITLERLAKDTYKVGKQSIVLLVEHEVYNTEEIIDLGGCRVRELYSPASKEWRKTNREIDTKEATKLFIEWVKRKEKAK